MFDLKLEWMVGGVGGGERREVGKGLISISLHPPLSFHFSSRGTTANHLAKIIPSTWANYMYIVAPGKIILYRIVQSTMPLTRSKIILFYLMTLCLPNSQRLVILVLIKSVR